MKQYCLTFLKRGLLAASGGPLILAMIYGILGANGQVTSLAPGEVCMGIVTVTLLAFIAAGIGVVYQIERLPLLSATAIHAGALYLDYLLIYLLNNWIPRDWAFIGVFTLCFAVGYALIWGIILLSIRHRTNRINRHLRGENRFLTICATASCCPLQCITYFTSSTASVSSPTYLSPAFRRWTRRCTCCTHGSWRHFS